MLFKTFAFVSVTGLLTVMLAVAAPGQPPAPAPVEELPVPRGVDVQARGPVHEAFATPTAESPVAPLVAKRPPAALEELPPAEKPEGDVAWIGGYWHWDEERQDFTWVSGCWRTLPPGRQWVGGYWRDQNGQFQWVCGFWAAAQAQAQAPQAQAAKTSEISYYPEPPAPPQVAPPGPAPDVNSFYMPGQWTWREGRYVWVAGYYARVQPGYVWVPSHYRWTPYGYVYVAGYWDYGLARRGLVYAPVVVDVGVVGPGFVYTPCYAVSDVVICDALWVRPAYCHYYFGDYYGPAYGRWGFECGFVYSRRHYDAIVVYRGWECRDNPRWHEAQINIYLARNEGRAPLPPRTLVEQRLIISRGGPNAHLAVVLSPGPRVAADRGIKVVALSRDARVQEKVRAVEEHKAVQQHRLAAESGKAGMPSAPKTASLPNNTSRTNPTTATVHPTTTNPAVKGPATKGPTTAAGQKTPPTQKQSANQHEKEKSKGG